MPQQPFDAEFMRRMAELTHGTLSGEDDGPAAAGEPRVELPEALAGQVAVYEIRGPLFFGAAQRAMGRIGRVSGRVRVLIMRLERVPTMDATGLVALESAIATLTKQGCVAILTGAGAEERHHASRLREDSGLPCEARLADSGRALNEYARGLPLLCFVKDLGQERTLLFSSDEWRRARRQSKRRLCHARSCERAGVSRKENWTAGPTNRLRPGWATSSSFSRGELARGTGCRSRPTGPASCAVVPRAHGRGWRCSRAH